VTQERKGQCGLVADTTESLVDDLFGLADGVQTEVGQLGVLQVAPNLLDGVEVGA
jgi:hypothetical protein